MSNGKAHTWKRVTATWPRHMRVQQPVNPTPAYPAFLAAPPQRTPPVPGQRPAKAHQHAPVSRHPVVLKVASHHRPQPLAGLARRRVRPRPLSCFLISYSFARIRFRTVLRRTTKRPLFRLISQICVNPRKSKVSGLPSPRLHRFAIAQRPNSISRVLSGCSSSPNFAGRSRSCSRNRSASLRCSNPSTKSSA